MKLDKIRLLASSLAIIAIAEMWLRVPAQAQDIATGGGKALVLQANVEERTRLGLLDSCEITYTAAFEDHIYRRGAVTVLRGALSFMGFMDDKTKPPGLAFKVTAFDMINNNPVFSPLKYAFLQSDQYNMLGKSVNFSGKETRQGKCEDGGQCMIYDILENEYILPTIFGHDFLIGLTRENGNSDVLVPISVASFNPKIFDDAKACSQRLFQDLSRKFQ